MPESPFSIAHLFEALAAYGPTLVGTYPLGLALPESDFDVLCSCSDLSAFERELSAWLGERGIQPTRRRRRATRPEASVTTLCWGGIEIEIFCQARPVLEQNGFRHLVVEGRLLSIGGEPLRGRVREAKARGLKTEPAFAEVLGLTGDPYATLLTLEAWSSERLRGLVNRALCELGPAPTLALHVGDRAELQASFRLADDSEQAIAEYRELGEVFVLRARDGVVGHVQLIETATPSVLELKSLAVAQALRGSGWGRRLVSVAIEHARDRGAQSLLVSTGACDTRLLRFYQQLGFRLLRIERDVFTEQAGYALGIEVDGIALRDQVWLDRELG